MSGGNHTERTDVETIYVVTKTISIPVTPDMSVDFYPDEELTVIDVYKSGNIRVRVFTGDHVSFPKGAYKKVKKTTKTVTTVTFEDA